MTGLLSIASATPSTVLTQAEAWEIMRGTAAFDSLLPRSRRLLSKVLLGDSGIRTRHFAASDPALLFSMSAEELNQYYEREAPLLAAQAVSRALKSAGIEARDLDALFLCSCTGYLCPGPGSHVAEMLGMRCNAVLHDILGVGCGAAIPALRCAHNHLVANPEDRVAVVAVEISSAAFYLNDDPGVLISLCLFGDAASASIWAGGCEHAWEVEEFASLHLPEHREKIRFVNQGGFLKNQLDRAVPGLVAEAVASLCLGEESIVCHGGGRDVLDAIAGRLPSQPLSSSREALARFGNCSSPSVLLALELDLALNPTDLSPRKLVSFGAGFSCHAATLRHS
ncbi:MAG: stilbene synthase [Verrucomicrobiia bacterium]